jgi:hypothetical protein
MSIQREKDLYQRVDEVLHYLWDPIGVAAIPMARDEYQSYVPQVVTLLNENANVEQITDYLNEVVTQRMGLSENLDATLHVVAVLLDWKAAVTAV